MSDTVDAVLGKFTDELNDELDNPELESEASDTPAEDSEPEEQAEETSEEGGEPEAAEGEFDADYVRTNWSALQEWEKTKDPKVLEGTAFADYQKSIWNHLNRTNQELAEAKRKYEEALLGLGSRSQTAPQPSTPNDDAEPKLVLDGTPEEFQASMAARDKWLADRVVKVVSKELEPLKAKVSKSEEREKRDSAVQALRSVPGFNNDIDVEMAAMYSEAEQTDGGRDFYTMISTDFGRKALVAMAQQRLAAKSMTEKTRQEAEAKLKKASGAQQAATPRSGAAGGKATVEKPNPEDYDNTRDGVLASLRSEGYNV